MRVLLLGALAFVLVGCASAETGHGHSHLVSI